MVDKAVSLFLYLPVVLVPYRRRGEGSETPEVYSRQFLSLPDCKVEIAKRYDLAGGRTI